MENNKKINCDNEFESLIKLNWQTKLKDSGTENWTENWFLDGKNSRVYNHKEYGMEIYAGARMHFDADHTVLWTKEKFSGDLKISYEFTRLDNAERCVNIIYMMARGSGEGDYAEDIAEWNELREVPAMKTYFNNMNLYHISYAAFGMDETSKYIRARRYCSTPKLGFEQEPDNYDPEDFFEPMVPHKLTFIKKGDMLYFHLQNENKEKLCKWKLDDGGKLDFGRVGLRQMFTRNSRYKNIEICTL